MPTATKIDPKKAAAETKEKLKNNAVTKSASDIFAKIQAKTGINNEKVEKWQQAWLAMPEKRTKYEHLQDAPKVVGEELLAMTNDIVDFIQGQEGGHSEVMKKIKTEGAEFIHHPIDFIKGKMQRGKEAAMQAKAKAEETAKKAKDVSIKAKETANKAKSVADKAKSTVKKTVKK